MRPPTCGTCYKLSGHQMKFDLCLPQKSVMADHCQINTFFFRIFFSKTLHIAGAGKRVAASEETDAGEPES